MSSNLTAMEKLLRQLLGSNGTVEHGIHLITYKGSQILGKLILLLAIYATVTCVVESDPPVADFSADETTICLGESIDFTDESTNTPTSWSWNFGDGSGANTNQNPSYSYSSAGTYTVTLTATNAEGSDDEVKTDYITVQDPPTGFGATANETELCAGESTILSMTGTFGGAYIWYDEDNNQLGTGPSLSITPSETTTFTATCDNGVCLVSADVTVTVNEIPEQPTISASGATMTASSGKCRPLGSGMIPMV